MTAWAAVVGTFTAAVVFTAVPKIDVRLAQSPYLRSHMRLQELEWLFDQYSRTNRPSSLGDAHAALKIIEEKDPSLTEHNLLLGGPVHEEDSPGNYILRQSTNGVEFFWFDADGAEHCSKR